MNKKAQMTLIISIVILTVSLVIIVGVWNKFFSKAEESTAESLCMGFNALRMRTKVDQGQASFNTVPLTCKTLDKVIPSDIYPQTKAGAMEEMRSLVAKCWWMFLEGAEKNMFAKDWPFGTDPCFTCYNFQIKNSKDIGEISFGEFEQSLMSTAYIANMDSSLNDCAPIGGGLCTKNFDGSRCTDQAHPELTTVVASNKCGKDEKCCISSKSNECINMGGKCIPSGETCKSDPIYKNQYDKWTCRTGTCCVKNDNFFSYIDYVQKYRGDGALLYEDKLVFKPGEMYAITFISPRPNINWDFVAQGGSYAVIAGSLIAIIGAGATIPLVIVAGVATGVSYLSNKQNLADIDTLYMSKLNTIADKCQVEAGTDGT